MPKFWAPRGAFSVKRHQYTSFDNGYLQNLEFDLQKAAELDCRQDGDVDLDCPIRVTFDYNANINWLVAGQRDGIRMKILKSYYVKYDERFGSW